jgi:hypothetical protein
LLSTEEPSVAEVLGYLMAPEKADLDTDFCHEKAAECRRLASAAKSPPVQIMLDHVAETWQRIARELIR